MKNELLRHILATIDYRFNLTVDESKVNFGDFDLGNGTRNPKEIVYHMYCVLHSTRIYLEEERFNSYKPEKLEFKQEITRFNDEIKNTNQALDVHELEVTIAKKLLQGPLSDILTHVGQLAMMQRLNDSPIKGEDYSAAVIKTGVN